MLSDTKLKKFWNRVEKTDGCWLWTGSLSARYGYMRIYGKSMAAHRISISLHLGRWIEKDAVVLHTCDNVACVNPEHLRIGTQADNVRDMVAKGRGVFPHGEASGQSVLTDKLVTKARQARKRNPKKWTWPRIAEKCGATETAVRDAVTGRTWKHIKEPPASVRPSNVVLSDSIVTKARRLRKNDPDVWTWKALATLFNLEDTGGIRRAVLGETWKHVKTPPCERM